MSEFEFENDYDKAAALCLMLTAAVRPSLPTAPMGHIKAHTYGSGKGYLCEVIACFATPATVEPMAFPTNDTDCRKELLSMFMLSPRVAIFDNLTNDILAHASLCLVLTSEKMTGRVLGASRMANVGTRTLLLSSGNNVGPVDDMVRRVLQSSLSPQAEQPANRTFKRPDLVAEIRKDREKYVSEALTIVKAYIKAGCPDTKCKPLNGYGDWSRLCRYPLAWLGLPDPATSTLTLMNDNPGRLLIGQFITAVYTKYGQEAFTVKQLCQSADGGLLELLEEIACEDNETVNRRSLGWWLKSHTGHIVDQQRIIRANNNSPARYQVQSLATMPDEYREASNGG